MAVANCKADSGKAIPGVTAFDSYAHNATRRICWIPFATGPYWNPANELLRSRALCYHALALGPGAQRNNPESKVCRQPLQERYLYLAKGVRLSCAYCECAERPKVAHQWQADARLEPLHKGGLAPSYR